MKNIDIYSSINKKIKNNVNFKFIKKEFRKSLNHLKERELEILRMRYGLDGYKRSTLKEVGEQFNITAERVRQIQVHALKKLLQKMNFSECKNIPLSYE